MLLRIHKSKFIFATDASAQSCCIGFFVTESAFESLLYRKQKVKEENHMPKNEIKEQFEEKYNLYGDMLYKIAFLYLGSCADAEDALQEVFVKLLSRTLPFKNSEHEKAWLIRVMQNKCRDMLRSARCKEVPANENEVVADNDFGAAERRADVISAIQSVPPQAKTVLILYYYYDYSVAQIAQTLKISNSAVKMRLKRGREILKSKLGDYENEK